MNREQILQLEGVRDRVADHVAELRALVGMMRSDNPRNVIDLRECVQCTHTAMAALDILGERVARLHCDTRPCDRIDGTCLKCERPAL